MDAAALHQGQVIERFPRGPRAEFGKKEKRTIGHDFRRSGAIEALAGNVNPTVLARKLANSIDKNPDLRKTYLPGDATVVRMADQARTLGRKRLRDQKGMAKSSSRNGKRGGN
jgi:hypothetical protein